MPQPQQHEEHQGIWWLPGKESVRLSGTLVLPPDDRPRVRLTGSFHEPTGFGTAFRTDVVLGILSTGPKVTLYRCVETKSSIGGFFTSELVPGAVLKHAHYSSLADVR